MGTANAALGGQKLGTSTEVGPAEYFELFSDDGRPTRGVRPAALLEPRPQGEVQCHAGIGYELAQNLDVPVLHMVEQLPDVLQFFATCLPVVAEPVIEVPKILLDRTPQRLGDCLRRPQMVEQLVDVPTVVSFSSLQQLTAEQIVDFPVPGRAGGGGRGGLQGSRPGQGSTASSSHVGAADGAGQGFFRTFPQLKKSAGLGPHSGSELGPDFTPWTPAAYGPPMVAEPLTVAELEDLGIWVDNSAAGGPGRRWVMHDTTDGPVWWDEPG